MLNSVFAAGLGATGRKRRMIPVQRCSPHQQMEPSSRPPGWGDAAQPGDASAGRWGVGCVAMTGRGRPETLTLRGKKKKSRFVTLTFDSSPRRRHPRADSATSWSTPRLHLTARTSSPWVGAHTRGILATARGRAAPRGRISLSIYIYILYLSLQGITRSRLCSNCRSGDG